MKAVNITWETDGEDVSLPTEIEIPNNIANDYVAITDYLSDFSGFLVETFEIA